MVDPFGNILGVMYNRTWSRHALTAPIPLIIRGLPGQLAPDRRRSKAAGPVVSATIPSPTIIATWPSHTARSQGDHHRPT